MSFLDKSPLTAFSGNVHVNKNVNYAKTLHFFFKFYHLVMLNIYSRALGHSITKNVIRCSTSLTAYFNATKTVTSIVGKFRCWLTVMGAVYVNNFRQSLHGRAVSNRQGFMTSKPHQKRYGFGVFTRHGFYRFC